MSTEITVSRAALGASEEVGRSIADVLAENAELRRALAVAQTENDQWREISRQVQMRQHEICMILGQCDYFLQTYAAQTAAARTRMIAKLRTRIKNATGGQ